MLEKSTVYGLRVCFHALMSTRKHRETDIVNLGGPFWCFLIRFHISCLHRNLLQTFSCKISRDLCFGPSFPSAKPNSSIQVFPRSVNIISIIEFQPVCNQNLSRLPSKTEITQDVPGDGQVKIFRRKRVSSIWKRISENYFKISLKAF